MGSSVDLFDDPEALSARIHNAHLRLLPQAGARYRARLAMVRLPGIHMAMVTETLPRLMLTEPFSGRVFFRLKQADEPPGRVDGRDEVVGTVRVKQRGEASRELTPGPVLMRSLSIAPEDLESRVEMLLGRSMATVLGGAERLQPAPDAFAAVAALQRGALALAGQDPGVLAHPTAAAALDARLGEALVDMIAGAVAQPDTAAQRRGQAILARVEAAIAARGPAPISLTALCAAGGCSAKTLEVLFLEHFGMTPIRFLRHRRLWSAHRALRAAAPGTTTVTEVALGCGFWELGRFAAAYRVQFGQCPSTTLRRAFG